MDPKEHAIYRKEFRAYSKEILASKRETMAFLVRAGINTPAGRLTKAYTPPKSSENGK